VSPLQSAKFGLMEATGLSKDALHVYVALALFLGSAALFRWRLSGWKPWTLVAAAAVVGEAWDLRDSFVHGTPIRLRASGHDLWNTLFWPTAFFALARWTKLLRR